MSAHIRWKEAQSRRDVRKVRSSTGGRSIGHGTYKSIIPPFVLGLSLPDERCSRQACDQDDESEYSKSPGDSDFVEESFDCGRKDRPSETPSSKDDPGRQTLLAGKVLGGGRRDDHEVEAATGGPSADPIRRDMCVLSCPRHGTFASTYLIPMPITMPKVKNSPPRLLHAHEEKMAPPPRAVTLIIESLFAPTRTMRLALGIARIEMKVIQSEPTKARVALFDKPEHAVRCAKSDGQRVISDTPRANDELPALTLLDEFQLYHAPRVLYS